MAYSGNRCSQKGAGVVVSDVEIESEFQFERRMFGSNPEQLRSLAAWLVEQKVEEVVMESTAQYWDRSPKGNRHMRRLLNQAANAAVKGKGSIFEIIYRRCVPRLGRGHCASTVSSDLVDPA
jgi:hypothetical protein